MKISELYNDVLTGKMSINDMEEYRDFVYGTYTGLMGTKNVDRDELRSLIMLCLDYYTYSESGDVLLTDREYDTLMQRWVNALGENAITESDKLVDQTQWDFVKHESPGMVGSVKKIYEFEELCSYLSKYKTISTDRKFRIAPKFDGISSAIKINADGEILLGVTRNDGVVGQNITKVIKNASNAKDIAKTYSSKLKKNEYVWVKTELVTTSWEFEKLVEEKAYKNRRSATSGIVNSPKNLHLAKYISIIPLAAHYSSDDRIEYEPMGSREITVSTPQYLMEEIEKMLSEIRDSSYPIRTDGVVIYPLGSDILPNYNDIMDDAIAFKTNTEFALTQVEFGYVSVGKLAYAVPMLRVKPVEVNETIVSDVSLGSFDKFVSMDLHENEQVLIYSAGNVIPQAKIPDIRHYPEDAEYLKIEKVCPYCGKKLSREKNTYRCENYKCTRVKSGRISNFIIKMKAENVSDKTIEDLFERGLIENIPDLFKLTQKEISELSGYGEESARIIIGEIDKIRNKETQVSSVLGALGIKGISDKKCKNLLKVMPIHKMIKMDKAKLRYILLDAEKTGLTTVDSFLDFLVRYEDMVLELLDIMNVVDDIVWKGNVVFTGGRDSVIEEKLNKLGYEVSESVNKDSIALISWSYNYDSTKCNSAKKKGIDILHVTEADKLLKALERR